MKQEFYDRTVFFPEQGILAVGDLHLGYEAMLKEQGMIFPLTQIQEDIQDLEKIFKKIKQKHNLKKIIFLGDIKHYFGFDWGEKENFSELFNFLKKYFEEKNIIWIKGNHDKFGFHGIELKNYHIQEGIAFAHGEKNYSKLFDKEINTLVLSHIHPSITLEDKQGIKKEKYKCFLTGKYNSKNIIIVPSFLRLTTGTDVREYADIPDFFIIPKNKMKSFNIHVIGEDKVYDFGKIKDLN